MVDVQTEIIINAPLDIVADYAANGRKLAYTYELVALIPRQKLVMRTAEGPFPVETTYTWTAIDDKTTKMTLRNKGNPAGFSKLFVPLMTTMMRNANSKDLINIKKIIERQ